MIAQQSLLRRLLLAFFTVLICIWLSIFLWDCYELNPNQIQDAESELLGTAYRILAVVQPISDRPAEIPAVVAKMEKLHYVFYSHNWHWRNPGLHTQVWKGRELLYDSAALNSVPQQTKHDPEQQPLPKGWVSSIATDPQSGITIRMATEFFGHWTVLGINSIGYYVNPLLFSLPFLLLPAWLIVRRGLRPLNNIVSEIEERSGANLLPLPPSSYLELSPLIAATNRLMATLSKRLEREQEFLIDAAHEIKTPLAIIHINAGALDTALTPQLIDEAKVGLLLGVERATHTVNQLLSLSLTLPQSGADNDHDDLTHTDLISLLNDQINAMTQLAMQRNIRVTLQAPAHCFLQLHRDSMASLIDNLLSNAIKYSPYDSLVTVSVKLSIDCVQLMVSDQGPGIEPALREKVFERFFRLPGHTEPGSGLGLAIAARAAERNNARVYLKTGKDGIGLAAVVKLPATTQDGAAMRASPVSQKMQTFMHGIRNLPAFVAEKFYRMRTPSLFRRILLGFMMVVAGMWICYLGWDVYDAKTVKLQDQQGELKRTEQRIMVAMQALADRPAEISDVVDKLVDLHYAFYKKRQWYSPPLQTQIWQGNELIYAMNGTQLPPTLANADAEHQPLPNGWIAWIESDPRTGVTVRMATKLVADWFLDRKSIGYFIKPLLFCLPLLLLLTAFVIRFGLRPLTLIAKEIERRSSSNLSPLPPSPYAELAPVVTSINRLMQRLAERLQREHEFLHDAAHELHKALAKIQTYLTFLDLKYDTALFDESTAGLKLATDQAAHTVHQLLALSRSSSDRDKGDLQDIDLVELLQDRLALAVPNAMQRKVKIALYAPEHLHLSMHRESMIALIDNLINNAVQFAPDNSKVAVSLKIDDQNVRLIVADKGPGIAPEFREKVFERFFHYPGRPDSGHGLGLAIAARAAARNFGMIFLETGRNGIGLKARVDFPFPMAKLR